MGKKAVFLWFNIILGAASILLVIISCINIVTPHLNPSQYGWAYFLGLLTPVFIIAGIVLTLYFLIRRSLFTLIPLLSILLYFNYITSVINFQIFPCNDKNTNYNVGTKRVVIATYNVHYFSFDREYTIYQTGNFLIDNRVDIVCFQEYIEQSDNRQERIPDALNQFPYKAVYNGPRDSTRLAIFSKFPIVDCNKIDFIYSNNGAMWADIMIDSNKVIRVFNNHLQTTGMSRAQGKDITQIIKELHENAILRAEQVDYIENAIKSCDKPVVVAGDLNDTPASYTYHKIKGDLIDGFRSCGFGFASTYRWYKKFLRIDYIFYSKDFKGIGYHSPNIELSDHNPVIVELVY